MNNKILVGKSKGKKRVGKLEFSGRILLKSMLDKYNVMCVGFNWLRIGSICRLSV